MDATLALDVGGTKIAAALVDGAGRVHGRRQAATPAGDAERVWAAVAGVLTDVFAGARADGPGPAGVGVCSAGPVDVAAGTVSPINVAGWRNFPLAARVAELTGLPVRLAGDGVCMALGESAHGAGRNAPFLLGVVVSTGVGGGLVLDGAPYVGRTGNAGHVGHVVVEPAGRACTCGGHGCVETVSAGPALVRRARADGWRAPAGADARALAAAAAAGNPVARRAFEHGARGLAAAFASVAATCDLDLVVVGGGLAHAGDLLFAPLRAALAGYAGLSFLHGLRVVPAQLGDDAGLIGAATLARRS